MILAALWFSEQKPTMSTLLGPLMEELNALLVNGIHVYGKELKLLHMFLVVFVYSISISQSSKTLSLWF